MTQEEKKELERKLLSGSVPTDPDPNASIADTMKKVIKRNPQKAAVYAGIVVSVLTIIICTISIVSILTGKKPRSTQARLPEREQESPMLEGFGQLQEENGSVQTEPAAQVQTGMDGNPQSEIVGVEQETQIVESTAAESVRKSYFLLPVVEQADMRKGIIQLADTAYQLPLSVSDFEAHGVALVLLGNQPPSEEVMLQPEYRDGYIQVDGERYWVRLKNTIECTYHDLTVYSIAVMQDEPGKCLYTAGGYCIGTEEASLPPDADQIETDLTKTKTYYTYGSAERVGAFGTAVRGNRTYFVCEKGVVVELSVLNDGSVTFE